MSESLDCPSKLGGRHRVGDSYSSKEPLFSQETVRSFARAARFSLGLLADSLALGIGVSGVMFNPLRFLGGERLVAVRSGGKDVPFGSSL